MPIPNTSVATSHGITIRFGSTAIGMIQTWAPTQSRPAVAVYELNAANSGVVMEQVPGNLGGLTITITRYDLFRSRMESIWGFEMLMLTDQTNPISIDEKWQHSDGTTMAWTYGGCWFTSLGRNLGAQGDRIINVNAALVYTTKTKMM